MNRETLQQAATAAQIVDDLVEYSDRIDTGQLKFFVIHPRKTGLDDHAVRVSLGDQYETFQNVCTMLFKQMIQQRIDENQTILDKL